MTKIYEKSGQAWQVACTAAAIITMSCENTMYRATESLKRMDPTYIPPKYEESKGSVWVGTIIIMTPITGLAYAFWWYMGWL